MLCSYTGEFTVKTNMEKKITKQSNDTKKKRQEEGNTIHVETEIQKSEKAFHQGWQKQLINSASLGL